MRAAASSSSTVGPEELPVPPPVPVPVPDPVPVPVPVPPPVGGGAVGDPPPPQATKVISTAVSMSCRISRSHHLATYTFLRVTLLFPSIRSKQGIETGR